MRKHTLAYTKSDLVDRLTKLARKLRRRRVAQREFEAATGISRHHVIRAVGTFDALLAAAGLERPPNLRRDDETLLRALRDACLKARRIVRRDDAARFGAFEKQNYIRRWGNWRGALLALAAWTDTNDPRFPYRAALETGPAIRRVLPKRPPKTILYGAPLGTGPLQHEPTNELGVVMLFGALATKLGFSIERVVSSFPDCEAKRCVAGGWQRVRIEFEYQSRNFLQHRHDPAGCDLIVCWEHNWPEAPIEVLELRREIEQRNGRQTG